MQPLLVESQLVESRLVESQPIAAGVALQERARMWLAALSEEVPQPVLGVKSVLYAPVMLDGERAVGLAVVRDAKSTFPRARNGEMGLEQAWALAACVRSLVAEDHDAAVKRTIVAVVDTPGQAFGQEEEARCLSMACGACVEAYAMARMAGHRVLTLVVGRAISGSFLAHGLQSDAIVALAGEGVMMHAMSAKSIARITRRTLAEVEKLAAAVLPMSYAIAGAHKLGIIDELIEGVALDQPAESDVTAVKQVLEAQLVKPSRPSLAGNANRASTVAVQTAMQSQWAAADAKLSSR